MNSVPIYRIEKISNKKYQIIKAPTIFMFEF